MIKKYLIPYNDALKMLKSKLAIGNKFNENEIHAIINIIITFYKRNYKGSFV